MIAALILAAAVAAAQPGGQPKKGPVRILTSEQRAALSRITSKGFITAQKTLPDGRKELTWSDGKNTVVTTNTVPRIKAKKNSDPRRAEIAAVKAEVAALKAENDKLKKEQK